MSWGHWSETDPTDRYYELPDDAWRDSAACLGRDPELWFPERGVHGRSSPVAEAKAICAGCPVKAQCLATGLTERYGVWGGVGALERGKLNAKQRERIRYEAAIEAAGEVA